MIRLVGSDIDGTLVREGAHIINPEYYDAINELRELGITFCACSGRQYGSMRDLFAPVADDIYFIAASGTLIRTKDEILHSWKIDPEVYLSLIQEIRKFGDVAVSVSLPDVSLIDSGEDSWFMHLLRDEYHYVVENVPDLAKIPTDSILEVSINSSHVEENAKLLQANPLFAPLAITVSGARWADITTREAGKGEAFALLQEYLEIGIEETVYFGDNLNDLPAFREAGVTATVSNARKEILSAADLVEPSFERMGVLRELRNIAKHARDYKNRG